MDDSPKIIRSYGEPLRQLVAAYVGVYSRKGLDLPGKLVELANDYLGDLRKKGAGLAIEKLLRAGCKRLALAATLNAVELISGFPEFQTAMFGSQRRVEQLSDEFEKTAELFDEVAKASSVEEGSDWPVVQGFPGPVKMASYLRAYASAMNPVPVLKAATNTRSIQDVERYALTSYVKMATGDWHDGDVSAVLAASTGSRLDEGTQRTWRNRKFTGIRLPIDFIGQLAELFEEEHDKKQSN
jgi:hypothetical protein